MQKLTRCSRWCPWFLICFCFHSIVVRLDCWLYSRRHSIQMRMSMLPGQKLLLVTKVAKGRKRPLLECRRGFNEDVEKEEGVRVGQEAGVLGLGPGVAEVAEEGNEVGEEDFGVVVGEEMEVGGGGEAPEEFQFELEAVVGEGFFFGFRHGRSRQGDGRSNNGQHRSRRV